jgi:PBP1b-binding outer membrane lipoprotein LpoB
MLILVDFENPSKKGSSMKIYSVILLLVFLIIGCQQNTVDESNQKSFYGKFKKTKTGSQTNSTLVY